MSLHILPNFRMCPSSHSRSFKIYHSHFHSMSFTSSVCPSPFQDVTLTYSEYVLFLLTVSFTFSQYSPHFFHVCPSPFSQCALSQCVLHLFRVCPSLDWFLTRAREISVCACVCVLWLVYVF